MLDNEKPAHQVTITKGFWLGQTPVTQQAYQRVTGQNPSHFNGANLPVETVNWDEAKAYCAAIGGRLPTEAEWEYAARAGSTGPAMAIWMRSPGTRGTAEVKTHEVGQKPPNAFGLFDMLGNVWQWMADWYGDYPSGEQSEPSGPASGQNRVLRGGSWDNRSKVARASYRGRTRRATELQRSGFGVPGNEFQRFGDVFWAAPQRVAESGRACPALTDPGHSS